MKAMFDPHSVDDWFANEEQRRREQEALRRLDEDLSDLEALTPETEETDAELAVMTKSLRLDDQADALGNLPLDRGQAAADATVLPRSLPPTAKALAPAVTRDELEEILAELVDGIADGIGEVLPSWLRELGHDPAELERRLNVQIGKSLQAEVDRWADAVDVRFERSLAGARQEFEKLLVQQANQYRQEILSLRGLVTELLTRLPVPVIQIPRDALKVDVYQQPSVVNIPSDAIRVTAEAPPARTSRTLKRITYGESGRPESIEEVLTEEEQ